MATDDWKTRIENGVNLSLDRMKDGFLDYLASAVLAAASSAFADDAVIGSSAIPVTPNGNNKVDVGATGGPYKAVDGAGRVIKFNSADARLQGIAIPPGAGDVYTVGLEVALLDDEPEANPDTAEIQYRKQFESIGRQGTPDLVTDNGDGTLTFRVDGITDAAGKDFSGRQVRVWLKAKSDGGGVGPASAVEATAIETCTVSLVGGHNVITTVGDLGQQAAFLARSTTAADYIVALIGPTVRLKTTEDLSSTAGCLYLADVTSVASGNPITTIVTTDQRLVSFDLADLGNVLRKDSHGSVKVRVHADASDASEPQLEVYDAAALSRFLVDETGKASIKDATGATRFSADSSGFVTAQQRRLQRSVTAPNTDFSPVDLVQDHDGNNRWLLDHCGLPASRILHFPVEWTRAVVATITNSQDTPAGIQTGTTHPLTTQAPSASYPAATGLLQPGTVNGDSAFWQSFQSLIYPVSFMDVAALFEFKMSAAGANHADWGMGIAGAGSLTPDLTSGHGLSFRKLSSDTNWKACSNNGSGAPTVADTGIAADTSFHRFRIEYHGSATPIGVALGGAAALFFIDEVRVATITTTLPAAALGIGAAGVVRNSPGASDAGTHGPGLLVANRWASTPTL